MTTLTAPPLVPLLTLHNPDSGRLDAQRMAEYLGVPLTQLAAGIGRPYQALHKTPDAPAAQEALWPIKRALNILAELTGEDDAAIRAWLNTPHPDLGGITPLQAILSGHAAEVEGMLAGAMAGIPS
jgi:Antitoxin Xre/MbcA/ParS C-terminal toxin-binding domain